MEPIPSGQRWALGALALLVVITAGWWLFALWPSDVRAPEWLERAQAVCFEVGDDGMPSAAGWLLLIGQPLAMFGALFLIWGGTVVDGLRRFVARGWGRGVVAATTVALVLGATAAIVRVASAESQALAQELPDAGEVWPEHRAEGPAPPLGLENQRGDTVRWETLEERPTLVTFAFGQCETVCPILVENALQVQKEAGGSRPQVVVITVDPWRDRPSRLPHVAEVWGMDEDAHILSGDVEAVNDVLDQWSVPRERDPQTGEILHPALLHVVDGTGEMAWTLAGGVEETLDALERLESDYGAAVERSGAVTHTTEMEIDR